MFWAIVKILVFAFSLSVLTKKETAGISNPDSWHSFLK